MRRKMEQKSSTLVLLFVMIRNFRSGKMQVMSNQDAVNCIRDIKDARLAAKRLNEEALERGSTDDISCVVIKFK